MNKASSRTKQQADFNDRPDDGLIWLHELVIDPEHPERIPAIKISRFALGRTIAEGLFPKPVYKRVGWRLGPVREWIRARAAL